MRSPIRPPRTPPTAFTPATPVTAESPPRWSARSPPIIRHPEAAVRRWRSSLDVLTFEQTIKTLRAALARPLPGADAHALLAPRPQRDWPRGATADDARHAAGLLLVVPIDARP